MRTVFLCLLSVLVLTTGCFKKDAGCPTNNIIAPASEVSLVENYLSANNITTAVKHPSGFYFEIVTQGSGPTPGECSAVNVGYIGKFTNGQIFDQTSSVSLTLANVIEGWRKGLPLIQKGGHIKLYIPPSLGYGPVDVKDPQTQQVVIPANSILIFDVSLIDVQ